MNKTSVEASVISIVIVNYNGLQYTKKCIESLFRFHISELLEVIVVDNNSSDGSQTELPKLFPSIIFLSLYENRGFGAANNAGAKKAKGEFLFFVNNDTLFLEETITGLKNILLSQTKCGIVSPKSLNEDRTFQLSFGEFPSIRSEFGAMKMAKDSSLQAKEEVVSKRPIKKDWTTGAAIMIKRKLFESVGGFDELFFMYFEDIDLCKAVNKKGYDVFYIPTISLIHFGGKSYEKNNSRILFEYRHSQLRYYDKHNSLFQRITLRVYLILKLLPIMLKKTDRMLSASILKLVFSRHF